ncbi:MAG: FAD:protein FMN transferase [Planctomycetota bacterium]|jgi:thiamine biosynthesis lipoprotein
MNRRRAAVILVVLSLLSAVLWSRATRRPAEPRYASFTADIMSSPISVTAPEATGDEAAEIVFEIFREIDATMSEWKPTSPLSAVNEAAGRDAVPVPEALRALIRRGIEIGERTDGAFDITWAALWGLWDFKASEPEVPKAEDIEERVALVDFRRVVVDDDAGTVALPEHGMLIGLGGIAKGHALDRAAAALRERGFDSFLISAAGQMMLGGLRGDRPWRIGIRDPRGGPDEYFAFLEVNDVSVSTSGDYERFFELDGVRYHHILDPRTGRPSRGLRSATVVCADATLADALSTALMILGPKRGLALVDAWDGVEAVLVDHEGDVHATAGMADRLHLPGRTGP